VAAMVQRVDRGSAGWHCLDGLTEAGYAKGFEVTMNLSPWPERTLLPDAGEVVAT
jgi:hypothetical protein